MIDEKKLAEWVHLIDGHEVKEVRIPIADFAEIVNTISVLWKVARTSKTHHETMHICRPTGMPGLNWGDPKCRGCVAEKVFRFALDALISKIPRPAPATSDDSL